MDEGAPEQTAPEPLLDADRKQSGDDIVETALGLAYAHPQGITQEPSITLLDVQPIDSGTPWRNSSTAARNEDCCWSPARAAEGTSSVITKVESGR